MCRIDCVGQVTIPETVPKVLTHFHECCFFIDFVVFGVPQMKLASWMVVFLLWQVMPKLIAVQGGTLWRSIEMNGQQLWWSIRLV